MKFAGTVLTGKNKGDVIEYTPEEKVREAVRHVVTTNPEIDGGRPFEGMHVFCSAVELKHVDTSPYGDPLGKQGFAHNIYQASGNASLQIRDTRQDRLMPNRTIKFEIEFIDRLQENGLPDLDIRKFDFQKE